MMRMIGGGVALLAMMGALVGPAEAGPREVNVHFRGVVERGVPLDFGPTAPAVRVRVGEKRTVMYRVTNLSGTPVTLGAVRKVEPSAAAGAVRQIQCPSLRPETLGPRESKLVPVEFQVESSLPASVAELTLGYQLKKVKVSR